MQKYNGSLIRQFPNSVTGNSAAGVFVGVFISGTSTPATLYEDDDTGGATLPNPLTTNNVGFYSFYAADGKYRIEFSSTQYPDLEVQLLDSNQVVDEFGAGAGLIGQAASAALVNIAADVAAVDASRVSSQSAMTADVTAVDNSRINAQNLISLDVAAVDAAATNALAVEIPAQINRLGLQYPPIAYISGLTLDSHVKTYSYNAALYIWGGALGTVTTGDFDETGWQPIQGDVQLRNDVTKGTSLIRDVKHLSGIFELGVVVPQYDGQQFSVAGFYVGSTIGGGVFVWLPSADKALNDGLNYYTPEAIQAWDGTHGDLSTLYDWSGTGVGVFRRIFETATTPEMAGAAGAANDDTLALNQYAQKVIGDVQVFESHTISGPINIPHTKSVIMSAAASISCTGSAFDAVFDVPSGVPERREYSLSNIDCNGIAGVPLWLRQGKDCDISCSNCIAPRMYGLHIGSAGTIVSYGHHIFNYRANRQAGSTSSNNLALPITNDLSVGLYEQNTTDIKGVNIEMVGFQKGHIGGGTGIYFSFHVWASQAQNLMDIGFVPGGSSKYFGAHADQVQIAAFDILSGKWRVGLYGCVHFNSPNGGTAVGTSVSVRVDPEVQAFICYGLEIKGNVAGVLQDFVVTNSQLDSVDFVLEGTTYEFVTNRLARYKRRNRGQNLEAVTDTGSRGMQIGTSSTQTFIQDDRAGGLLVRGSASGFEFNIGQKPMSWNGNSPIARPTITGSRDANTALQNLLQALASYGLIINSTDP